MKSMTVDVLRRLRPDGFLTGIVLMIVLAWFVPDLGPVRDFVDLGLVVKVGITLLFFFYGLKLSPERLRQDMTNWRLHLLVQGITFLAFPLLVLPFWPLCRGTGVEPLWLAVFFLATLPSTVSSSVVMVSIAGGNIPSAIFNASISGILGIVLTPAWMGIFLGQGSGVALPFASIITDLAVQVLVPVVAGLAMHRWWGAWVKRRSTQVGIFDKAVILVIVFRSFSDSFLTGVFAGIPTLSLLALATAAIGLFFLVFGSTRLLTRWLGFNRADGITVLFCGSKKSLVHGSVMVGVLFAGSSAGSLFLVPVMIYHAFQLFFVSLVARKMAAQARTAPETSP